MPRYCGQRIRPTSSCVYRIVVIGSLRIHETGIQPSPPIFSPWCSSLISHTGRIQGSRVAWGTYKIIEALSVKAQPPRSLPDRITPKTKSFNISVEINNQNEAHHCRIRRALHCSPSSTCCRGRPKYFRRKALLGAWR